MLLSINLKPISGGRELSLYPSKSFFSVHVINASDFLAILLVLFQGLSWLKTGFNLSLLFLFSKSTVETRSYWISKCLCESILWLVFMMPRSLLKWGTVFIINIKGSRFVTGLFYMNKNLKNSLKLETFWLKDDFKDLSLGLQMIVNFLAKYFLIDFF